MFVYPGKPEVIQVKIRDVDPIATQKGFRRNRKYWVRSIIPDVSANKARGPLHYLINRAGEVEGFYADQFRVTKRGYRVPVESLVRGLNRAWCDWP